MNETKAEVFIPLSQGKIATIDFEDFEKIRPYKWHAVRSGARFYARTCRFDGVRDYKIHWVILGKPAKRFMTDHINGDGLDNRKSNLRICTNSENQRGFQNRGKFRGTTYDPRKKKWRAHISIGSFETQEEAARAYDIAAKHHFGEFAGLNFPKEKS